MLTTHQFDDPAPGDPNNHDPAQQSAWTTYAESRHQSLSQVSARTGQTIEALKAAFKVARRRGERRIRIELTPALAYEVIETSRAFKLSILYSQDCPVCHVYFCFKHERLSEIYIGFHRTIQNFIRLLKKIIIDCYETQAFIEQKHSHDPHGIRLTVIGINSDLMAEPINSLVRAIERTGVDATVRMEDQQRGKAP